MANKGPARQSTDLGRPTQLIFMKLEDIHYLCICTWILIPSTGLHKLKYKNTACIATYWHNQIERKHNSDTNEPAQ